jgi:hypothetical protein
VAAQAGAHKLGGEVKTMKPLDTFYSFCRSVSAGTAILRNGVEPLRLPPSDVCGLTATQFEWGYEGSGPEVTTVALLIDFLEDENRALELAWQVKVRLIAKLPIKGAVVTASELLWLVTEIEDERASARKNVGGV